MGKDTRKRKAHEQKTKTFIQEWKYMIQNGKNRERSENALLKNATTPARTKAHEQETSEKRKRDQQTKNTRPGKKP